jgi:hypothetical protein
VSESGTISTDKCMNDTSLSPGGCEAIRVSLPRRCFFSKPPATCALFSHDSSVPARLFSQGGSYSG